MGILNLERILKKTYSQNSYAAVTYIDKIARY